MTGTSPPGPLRCGSTTWSANPVATAASNALPPRSSTDIPTPEASQCVEATIPNVPRSSGRVVKLTPSVHQIERGADHRLSVDRVVVVELGEVARLAEALHAEADVSEEGERVRVAVEQRDHWRLVREEAVEHRRVGVGQPGAGLERAVEQVGGGDAHDLGVGVGLTPQDVRRLDRLG